MPNRRGALIPAIFLILLGAWLLARNLNVPLPGLSELWPAFPVFFGLACLVQFFLGGRRDDGLIFVGVAATLAGVFLFAFTLGYLRWAAMGVYWPVWVLIAGGAFLAQWLVRPRDRGLLVPALLGLAVGGVALPLTLGKINPALAQAVEKLWPAALIVLGLIWLVSYFVRSQREA